MDFPIKNADFRSFFVCLPEGNPRWKWRSFLGVGFIMIHVDHGWIQGTLSDPMHALQPKFTKQSMFFGAWNDPGDRWSWCDHGDGRIFRTSPKKPRNPDSSAWKKKCLALSAMNIPQWGNIKLEPGKYPCHHQKALENHYDIHHIHQLAGISPYLHTDLYAREL